jgi:hypothetical protein
VNHAVRLSCWAAVVGAGIEIIAVLGAALFAPGKLDATVAQSAVYIGINLASAIGAVLLLYGMPGVFARWGQAWGGTGLAGIALIALVWMLLVFFSLIAGTFLPWLAVKAPDLFKDPSGPPLYLAVSIIVFVATIAGTILMAIPILRRRVSPRWVGFLLIASAVMFFVYVGALASPPNVALALVGSLSPIFLCAGLGYLSYLGASSDRAEVTAARR